MQNNKEKKNVFEIENLSFAYDKHEVLNNLNLSFHEGIVTTMIGPNGCGKSTLLQLMTKNLKPAGGKILLQGEDIAQIRQKQFAQSVAVVHQYNTAPPDLTVEKLVSYGRIPYHKMGVPFDKAKDMERIEWALEITNTTKHKDKTVSQLSGGQKQRVWIAMALAQDAKVLLLDEPTTYLDIRYQLQILRLIRRLNEEYGFTIIMVLHDVNQSLYYSDEIVALKAGKCIAQGSPQQILTGELIQKVYDVTLKVSDIDGKRFILPKFYILNLLSTMTVCHRE